MAKKTRAKAVKNKPSLPKIPQKTNSEAPVISLGIPAYSGGQSYMWWLPLMRNLARWFEAEGCTIQDIHYAGTMDTGMNRNRIVKDFMETDVEWLWWIDGDNSFNPGSVRRLVNGSLHG